MGYSAIYAFYMLLQMKLGDLFTRIARGEKGWTVPLDKKNFGLSVRVSIPPYPSVVDAENEKFMKPFLKSTPDRT